ncbi:cell division protein FtsQ/DivIB [Paenibacillus tarimensis]
MSQIIPVLREPKTKRNSSRKLLVVLFLLFVVLLAVLFFNSSISKISSITFTGQQFTMGSELEEASGIHIGDPFFGTGAKEIQERIENMPTIDEAVVTKKFPGEILIQVVEFPAVAYEVSEQGAVTAILSSGTTVAMKGRDYVVDKPVLSQWKSDDPGKEKLSKLLAEIPRDMLSDFSEIIPFPSNSYPDRIKIYTRTHFEVITAVSLLKEKIPTLSAVVETQGPGRVTLLLADRYEPFENPDAESEDSNEKEATQ